MKTKFIVIISLMIFAVVTLASSELELSTASETQLITKICVRFLNGNTDLQEAIEGKSSFAKLRYGATDMRKYVIRARLTFKSSGEVIEISPLRNIYTLANPIPDTTNTVIYCQVNPFEQQDEDNFFYAYGNLFKIGTIHDNTAYLVLRMMGPSVAFDLYPQSAAETDAQIDMARKIEIAFLRSIRPLNTGDRLAGFGDVSIPYTKFS